MKVTGRGGASTVRPSAGAKAGKAGGAGFSLAPASSSSAAAPAQETASASALGALIALQSGGERNRNRARAERMLMLMERLRDGLLSGRMAAADLEALGDAASAKLDDPDPRLAALYEEIALRARVELAKIGR